MIIRKILIKYSNSKNKKQTMKISAATVFEIKLVKCLGVRKKID